MMWTYPDHFDVIVVGAGHAGCEAALAAARCGARTLLLTMTLDTVAKMSCNPAIGGIAKGHLVREIDALGGEMGKVTEVANIHSRLLNRSRGPAVWAPRAQCDRVVYQFEMKRRIENTPNLFLKQGTTEGLVVENDHIAGVHTKEGIEYRAPKVILCSGTFMRGLMHIGDNNAAGGRAGDRPAVGISADLERLGFELGRLKTGTPPRLHMRSLDLSLCEEQTGEENVRFSFDDHEYTPLPRRSCWITYTTPRTQEIIEANIHRSPMYSGKIGGVGPRYCPSIEDKVMRFRDKNRHQVFLEPEGISTQEVYVNGISSSLPFDVQVDFVRSIIGLENAEIMRPAYAVEYDYVESGQIQSTLETKTVAGLYLAGQVNGTSGYEEAAAQGLMAGINAASSTPLILKRSEAYIAVMIDDLVTKGIDEPYRMFTSRAEHRLLLRQDNADIRLTSHGHAYGLINDDRYNRFCTKRDTIASETTRLSKTHINYNDKQTTLGKLLCRPEITYNDLVPHPKSADNLSAADLPDASLRCFGDEHIASIARLPSGGRAFSTHQHFLDGVPNLPDHGAEINLQIELTLKYAGYVKRQEEEVARHANMEEKQIPPTFDYLSLKALRNEARERFTAIQPRTLGQASRIPGISPADISVLVVALKT